MEAVAAEDTNDPDVVRDVLLTYRHVTTAEELLSRLLARYPLTCSIGGVGMNDGRGARGLLLGPLEAVFLNPRHWPCR